MRRVWRRRNWKLWTTLGCVLVCFLFGQLPWMLRKQKEDERTNVLILSYFRAGSSALRRLFDLEDVLVWEDPVAPLASGWKQLKKDESLRQQHDRDRALMTDRIPSSENRLVKPLLSAILSCDILTIHKMAPDVLEWSVGDQLYMSMSWVERMLYGLVTPLGLKFGLLRMQCQKYKLSVVRTTHLPSRNLLDITRTNPDLKVIFVPRDPRGIVSSWVNLGIFDEDLGPRVFKSFCDSLSLDLTDFYRVATGRPHHTLTLRAEDIAHDPDGTVTAIYEFLGICKSSGSPHAEAIEETWNLRNDKIHLKEAMNPDLIRIHDQDLDWGGTLRQQTVDIMSEACKHALVKLKYETFRSL